MIRLLFVLMTIAVTLEPAAAQQARFDEATHELDTGDLDRARTLYRELEQGGHHAPELFWNQAIVALESDSAGLAKYYLLRASQYPEFRDQARERLDHLEDRFSRRSSILPPLPWDRLLNTLHYRWGATTLFWVALLLFTLIPIGWTLVRIRGMNNGRLSRIGLVLSLSAAGALLLASIVLEWRESATTTGIHVGSRTPVHQQPDTTSAVVATLYEGYLVYLPTSSVTESNPLYPVKLENGMRGWVLPDNIRTFQGTP